MPSTYFNCRKAFDFRPHLFQVGTFLGSRRGYEDNLFLVKIYEIQAAQFASFYDFHFSYARENKVSDKDFFKYIWDIVAVRIAHLKRRNPFSSYREQNQKRLHQLTLFQTFLREMDKWNLRPIEELLEQKERLIAQQQEQIVELQSKLRVLQEYDVAIKAMVQDDHLPTFIDLIQQMRNLQLPNGRNLLRSDHESPYYKMLAKYFSYEGKDIPVDTLRNYFGKKAREDSRKGVAIPQDKKIFHIVLREHITK
ncbi:hypothetical protein PQ465_20660 [Sphingobacterium oryzagri]|uniref:Uncharacterized protein n=1 Tax=Sphingobacterium oryzagri TaxID=3025669 RepID=A0ABY7WJC2_9SPHI|nr:hypothetical protein [Sphingobacterium sp. KACC 22765]WDF68694.1 hypothetical protein PQ465_20660 [Sphingobacterium sp. KACC 22765]